MDIRHFFSKFRLNFRNKTRGYVVLLLVVFVPLIMLGTKLALDLMTRHDAEINMQWKRNAYRPCAKEAALAVAQNWNPGRSLDHQKRAALKVADRVYNDNAALMDATMLQKAVPGIQLSVKDEVIAGKGFDPLRVTTKAITSSIGQIQYVTETRYKTYRYPRVPSNWNPVFMTWRILDKLTSLDTTYDTFDELDQTVQSGKYVLNHVDRYIYPHQWQIQKNDGYPTRTAFSSGTQDINSYIWTSASSMSISNESGYTEDFIKSLSYGQNPTYYCWSPRVDGTYTRRAIEDNIRVQVSVEDDKIKVTNDAQSRQTSVGYAIPAECNVDIVLACPVNGAACNINNRDQNSTTPELPSTSSDSAVTVPSNNVSTCPIYQIGQAFRVFAKEFYHIRGVTMGLIPYSGKVSLDPDVANGYTMTYNTYNYNRGNFCTSYYIIDQNSYQAYLRGAILYDSYGMTNAELNNGYSWNSLLTGCPIRCRGRSDCITGDHHKTGNNCICLPDILSNAAPGDRTKFFKQNSNPCYGGYANLLTMRCERNCTVYLPNPYYIIEPTADVQKIYEICGALYPFYDEYNVSNFLFIPITWANNLWQSWTRNPEHAAVDTDASGNGGQLSVPSKITAGRKKVLILVVNKPDWFEPHELTYLGFDNDCSELCMIESDRIDFSQNYSDTSKKFADGSLYDGTIQGPKKILKFQKTSGNDLVKKDGYHLANGTYELTFPKKYLVKLVIEGGRWEYFPQALNKEGNICTNWARGTGYAFASACKNGRFAVISFSTPAYSAYSDDGKTWHRGTTISNNASIQSMAANDSYFVALQYNTGGKTAYSSDGTSWTYAAASGLHTGWLDDDISWNGSQFFALTDGSALYTATDITGSSGWSTNSTSPKISDCEQFKYGGGYYVRTKNKTLRSSTSINHSSYSTASVRMGALNYGPEYWVILTQYGDVMKSSDASATSWATINGSTSNNTSSELYKISRKEDWSGIVYNPQLEKWMAYTKSGDVAVSPTSDLSDNPKSSITFPNISELNYDSVIGRKEIYIEPSKISEDGKITMQLANIRLISAEITNRPYKKATATCYFDGTNIKTNAKRLISVKVTPQVKVGSITFYDDNKIEDNVGTHTIPEQTTFNFSGPNVTEYSGFPYGKFSSLGKNFAHNLSKYKVRYSADNMVRITSATLTRQFLRDYGGHYNRGNDSAKQLIVSNGKLGERPSGWGIYIYPGCGTEESKTVENFRLCADSCIKLISGTENWAFFNGCADMSLDGTLKVYGLASTFYFWVWGGIGNSCITCNGTTISITKSSRGKELGPVPCVYANSGVVDADIQIGAYFNLYGIESKQNKSLLNTSIDTSESQNANIEQNKGIALQRLSSKISDQIVAGDYICFQGDGELSVTVTPVTEGTLTHVNTAGSNVSRTFTSTQTITINPDEYKYENDGNGLYTIKLTCSNVTLSNLQLLDTSDVFTWDKIHMPELSRWIDYSKNPYDALACTNSEVAGCWRHNGEFYVNENSNGYCTGLGYKDYPYTGDHCSFTYSDNLYTIVDHCNDGWVSYYGRKTKQYRASGLSKVFTAFNRFEQFCLNNKSVFNDYNGGAAGSISLIMQTMTLPINTALYGAYHDSAIHAVEWYRDKSGNEDYDASNASKNVTKAACTKLKNDFGNNLRIYLIKYRKQTEYKHKVTGDPTNYDYTYLDDCTTYMYDVSGENELKNTMKTISSDIKTWAGHTPAKNVE